jgi:hypothetical protein
MPAFQNIGDYLFGRHGFGMKIAFGQSFMSYRHKHIPFLICQKQRGGLAVHSLDSAFYN